MRREMNVMEGMQASRRLVAGIVVLTLVAISVIAAVDRKRATVRVQWPGKEVAFSGRYETGERQIAVVPVGTGSGPAMSARALDAIVFAAAGELDAASYGALRLRGRVFDPITASR